jgi:hypothetical protein
VGSISNSSSEIEVIKKNVVLLIQEILRRRNTLVIRHLETKEDGFSPIDNLAIAALNDLFSESPEFFSEGSIILIKEPHTKPNVKINFGYHTYSAAGLSRIDFYTQLINQAEMIIGIGGRDGLVRLALLCEITGRPFLPIPGGGEAADMLWADFFQKNFQARYLNAEESEKVKKIPFIDSSSNLYPKEVIDVILLFFEKVSKATDRKDLVSLDRISPNDLVLGIKRFTVRTWISLLGIVSFIYWLGTQNFIQRILGI